MSITSTQSGYYAASDVCGRSDIFETWAGEVSLRLPPSHSLPAALEELVGESCRFPGWLFDQDSNEYKQFKIVSTHDPDHLPLWLAGTKGITATEADDQVSHSTLRALDRILHLLQLHESLFIETHGLNVNESDLRQALDDLARHVWFSETGPQQGYLFRSDSMISCHHKKLIMVAHQVRCALKLPKTNKIKIADSIVDSVAFFFQPKAGYSIGILPEAKRAILNSIVQGTMHLHLVHWVTEYKTSVTEDVKRQVLYGMTSGLYQRRALGRLDDFVFGTAHSESDLVVYAARWERVVKQCPSETGQPPDISDEGNTATDPELGDTLAATAKKRSAPGKSVTSLKGTGAAAGPSGESFPNRVFKSGSEAPPLVADDGGGANTNSGYEIVVYQLGEYVTTHPVDMIQYYLLIRASRKLADGYRANLFTDPWATVARFHRFSIGRHPLGLAQQLLQNCRPCTKTQPVGAAIKHNRRTATQMHGLLPSSQKTQRSGRGSGYMSDKLRPRNAVPAL